MIHIILSSRPVLYSLDEFEKTGEVLIHSFHVDVTETPTSPYLQSFNYSLSYNSFKDAVESVLNIMAKNPDYTVLDLHALATIRIVNYHPPLTLHQFAGMLRIGDIQCI